ncbi:MAG: TusA-related sulfurtransferase [Gammaproteobacteria bacterium]|jgi:TusA-related sulfurtransferase
MSAEIIKVDARRLLCPMPVIRLQDRMIKLPAGTRIEITCTDPGTLSDIPTWCRINNHTVISSEELEYEYIFVVEKAADEI